MSFPLTVPAAPAPPGESPNLTNPPNQDWTVTFTVAICLASSTIVVWLRVYVTLFITKYLRWDDVLVFVCWLAFIAYSIVMLEATQYGSTVNLWDVSAGHAEKWGRLAYIEELMYSIILFATKLAVLLLYLRMFVPKHRAKTWVYWSIVIIIVVNTMLYTANTFVMAFTCTPPEKEWKPTIPGHCIDSWIVIIGTGAWNVLSDLLIMVIPIAVIWRLHMSIKKRLETIFVFCFQMFCLGSSIARLVYSIRGTHDRDETVILIQIALWTYGEITSCFLACCVPMIPRIIHRYSKKGSSYDLAHHQVPTRDKRNKRTSPSARAPRGSNDLTLTLKSTISEEDPYYVGIESPTMPKSPAEKESPRSSLTDDHNIMVSSTVDVASVSQAHIPAGLDDRLMFRQDTECL